tara:strand:+ start:22 stop:582 length:561 start_codon:yes stop_codon:yes gene_type:complete
MKSSDFMEKIKKVIAEEVRIAVRAEMRGIKEEVKSALSEMINEGSNKKVDHNKAMEVGMNNYNQKAKSKKPEKSKQVYHKDPLMQSILQETAASMVNESSDEEWPTMNGRDFNSSDAHLAAGGDFKSGLKSMMGIQSDPVIDQENRFSKMLPNDTKHLSDKVDDATKNALTRDYSTLMKAINKKGK